MASALIKNQYSDILNSFGKDLQSAVDTALQKYLIELITIKITEMRKQELMFETKYKCNYITFSQQTAINEDFILHIEQNINKMWESELAEWEFCHKGIDDWTKQLQNILLIF